MQKIEKYVHNHIVHTYPECNIETIENQKGKRKDNNHPFTIFMQLLFTTLVLFFCLFFPPCACNATLHSL